MRALDVLQSSSADDSRRDAAASAGAGSCAAAWMHAKHQRVAHALHMPWVEYHCKAAIASVKLTAI